LTFYSIDDDVAEPILSSFHYILSHRPASKHFGLRAIRDHGWPLIMCSVSPFDLSNVAPVLENHGIDPNRCVVLSRVFAFPACPPNAVSRLLGRVRRWLRDQRPDLDGLITYVNPNVGFTGASYYADNWMQLALEDDTRYAYWDGNYITDRQLAARLSMPTESTTTDSASRVTYSQPRLRPLQVFFRSISKAAKTFRTDRPTCVRRWVPGELSSSTSQIPE
jgi:hypothetical protein